MRIYEFEKEFKRLYLPLGMYALRIVGDACDAEDIVQNSFLKVWQSIDDGRQVENFTGLMYRTVRNEALDYLRRCRPTVRLDEIPEADAPAIDTSERDARIWRAVDSLPEKCREIFLMSKRDGLSNGEIAEELGLSEKTVRNQMSKAYSRLREALSDGHKPFFLPFL
ncbi:MAG: RNA polymerase sigma-70 factor [Paramuribaculum sp.]|nr:RNA polymerase sigma-70 factor [Paramuribaculum sp.]MDE6488525.1 RNA polymerase sigma-70 factor [Paramuribaculum sp.]